MRILKTEMDITRRCNMLCCGCNRLCNIIQDNNSDITLDETKQIIDEINQFDNIYHKRFVIIGGEPSLNPQCYEICKYIKENLKNVEKIEFGTNHSNAKLCKEISKLNINVRWDEESSDLEVIRKRKFEKHQNFLVSPFEKNLMLKKEPCYIYKKYGPNIHKYKGKIKYFICGSGSSLCKLLNKEELMFDTFKDLMYANIKEIQSIICPHCMHHAQQKIFVKDNKDEVSNCFKDGLNRLLKDFNQ
jgi:organic radical activating enzyme